jgi:hypothetical protein
MTYDEWAKSNETPPPPFSVGGIQYGPKAPGPFSVGGIQYGGNASPTPPPPRLAGALNNLLPAIPGLGEAVRNTFQRAGEFMQPRPTTNPSFQTLPGEKPALQMPGLSRIVPPALRFLANQPQAQLYGPMQNATNAMMYASAAKTDEERARENTRGRLEEYRLKAMEPLMMRKYAEKMGYMPEPGQWQKIWRAIKENYTRTEGGTSRGYGTPAPR